MLGRLWPRFALEACFLVAVAVVAGLLHLSTTAIIVAMTVAYLATVIVEWTATHVATKSEGSAAVEPEAFVVDVVEVLDVVDVVEVVEADTADPLVDEYWLAQFASEPGAVEQVRVKEGDTVEHGAVLVVIA